MLYFVRLARNNFIAGGVTLAAMALALAAQASPVAGLHGLGLTTAGTVVKVHDDGRDDEEWARRHYRHAYRHRDDGDDVIVEAPYTRVRHGDRVVVDAPFAHVYSGRYGQHVVAPFVDLWIPR